MKYLLFILIFFIFATPVYARSGCCSHHGGVAVDGCSCNDGTPLSDTCAPYYNCSTETDEPVTIPDMTQDDFQRTMEEDNRDFREWQNKQKSQYLTITPAPTKTFLQFVTDASPVGGVFFTTLGFFIGTLLSSLAKK